MAAAWLELTLSESVEALWFCSCPEDLVDIDYRHGYLICMVCGTCRNASTMRLEHASFGI